MRSIPTMLLVLAFAVACGGENPSGQGTSSNASCGEGTGLVDGECVSVISCGTGTTRQGLQCVPTGSSTLRCGANTVGSPGTELEFAL